MESFITLFVDNLADRVNPFSLRKKFTDFGIVRDVFIPNKRGKISGRRFGFVRFDCPISADIAVDKANGSRFMDNTIFVKRAAFNKKGLVNFQKESVFAVNNKDIQNSHNPITSKDFNRGQNFRNSDSSFYKSEFGKGSCPSFANVVSGKKLVDDKRLSVYALEVDIEWLERSIVAKLHAHRDVDSISEAFRSDGVFNIHIRAMGGNLVLLTFPTSHDMNCMLEGGELSWLSNWFVDAKPWNLNNKVECSRLVWLNCYGIPINLWNANTFFNIGKLWGEIISLDEATSKKTSFSVGKIKISTNAFEVINHSINLEHDGMVYPIRVVEEQVVVNNFMKAICECKGCSFPRVDYSLCPREILSSEGVKSDVKGMVGDDTFLDNRSNVIEHFVEKDSSSNLHSAVGESVSPPGNGVLGSQEKDMARINDDCLGEAEMLGKRDGFCSTGENSNSVEKSSSLEKLLGAKSDELNSINKVVFGGSGHDYDDWDLVSNEPLIKYVECKCRKKTHKTKIDNRKKILWSKNPLKAVLFSRTVSRDNIRKVSGLGLKKGSFKGILDGHTHSFHEEVSSVFRKRNLNLIKEARENMKMGVRCGVKYHGRESCNIKKLLELRGIEISEQEIKAEIKVLDTLEGVASISVEF